MLFTLMIWLILIVLGLLSVAFITLLERKLLGLSQIRLGPNKVSVQGLLQPVADGVKLLWKESHFIMSSQSILFMVNPILLLILFIISWTWVLPWLGDFVSIKYSSLLFFSLLGLGAYAVILTGWSSTSAFSKLGSLRGMLQSLSFEVALILVFFSLLCLFMGFQLKSEEMNNSEFMFIWVVLWIILSLMETNRAPFDLLEGESELISGFNVEMSSLSFVYLFLSEYGMVLIMALMTSVSVYGSLKIETLLVLCGFLFMRSCFPRVRYDIMMTMMWKSILPFSVIIFVLFMLL